MLNVACFVHSCLTDADFVIFSNYCLIGTRLTLSLFFNKKKLRENPSRHLTGRGKCHTIN